MMSLPLVLLPLLAQAPELPPPVEPPAQLLPPPVATPESGVLRIAGYTILTLYGPDGAIRVQQAQERFADVVRNAPQPQLSVQLRGNDGGAIILVNGRGLLELKPEDTLPHGTRRVLPVAQVWAGRLKAVLANPTVLKSLFVFSGLPDRFSYNGAEYLRAQQPANDVGRFTTDGTRISANGDGRSHVLFWDSQLPLPQATYYLLNRYREFVPYNRS